MNLQDDKKLKTRVYKKQYIIKRKMQDEFYRRKNCDTDLIHLENESILPEFYGVLCGNARYPNIKRTTDSCIVTCKKCLMHHNERIKTKQEIKK